ncbi:MAG: NUDIX domain-containing protein [Patescibacteria group bacterium]
MIVLHKSALLILDNEKKEFLVTRRNDHITQWLLPGGKIEEGETVEDALVREIDEELGCSVLKKSLEFIGEYEAPAAGRPGQIVNIRLFQGQFSGTPEPKSEIKQLGWLSKTDAANEEVSEIIRMKVIPDLVKRGILK